MNHQADKPWLSSYEARLAPEIPIPEITFTDMLEEGLTTYPDRVALHFLGTRLTFRELNDLAATFASFLRSGGYGPDDVVGIQLPNIPEYPIALAGALKAGCAITGISPLLTAREMVHQINDAEARVIVILDSLFEERLLKIKDKIPNVEKIVVANVGNFLPWPKRILGKLFKKIPTGAIVPVSGKAVLPFKKVLASHEPVNGKPEITPDNTCLIQYTGGTTGLPKGTELTHRNLVANTTHAKEWAGWDIGNDVLCSAFPYFHLAGLAFGMVAMSTANTQCLIPDPRNTDHFCREIDQNNATVVANVPTLYQMLLDNPRFRAIDFSMLKICLSGAAPFSVKAINAFEKVVGKGKVLEVYGMTETSPLVTMNPLEGTKKIGSVGIPIQNTAVKLVDTETGTREVAPGEAGEVIVRGPQVMKGYHNQPEETAHALREFQGEKWLYTGDVAKMDEDGFFYIVDRTKDMLIVSGYKVFSREVEETLYQHPDIEFCAIVGVPDPDRPGSERVKAVIQLKSAAKQKDPETVKSGITAFCRENLVPYKIPKIVELVDEMPLTAVGKVEKKALR